jgi:tetratricopeptide (TPR) repeat protein
MKLRTKVSLFRSTSWPLVFALALPAVLLNRLVGWPLVPMAIVLTGVLFAVSRWVPMFIIRRAHARLGRLLQTNDFAGAHAELEGLREVYEASPRTLERFHFTEGAIFAREERYAEAARKFESLDRRLLGADLEPWVPTSLAWSMAHAGRVQEAVPLARTAMEAQEPGRRALADDLRGAQLGTLGTVLVLAGNADEGVPLLEQALARGGPPPTIASRAFYLGEGLRALGRDREAAEAYDRAVAADPKGPFGKRAKARASDPTPYR